MRKSIIAAAALMLATTASAWAQPASTDTSSAAEQPGTAAMQRHARDTWEDIKDYSAAQKKQALSKAHEGLKALDHRIDRAQQDLDRHWNDMSQDARLKKQKALGHLKDDRVKLQAQYRELKAASADNWDAAKARFGAAWESTKSAWHALVAPNPPADRH